MKVTRRRILELTQSLELPINAVPLLLAFAMEFKSLGRSTVKIRTEAGKDPSPDKSGDSKKVPPKYKPGKVRLTRSSSNNSNSTGSLIQNNTVEATLLPISHMPLRHTKTKKSKSKSKSTLESKSKPTSGSNSEAPSNPKLSSSKFSKLFKSSRSQSDLRETKPEKKKSGLLVRTDTTKRNGKMHAIEEAPTNRTEEALELVIDIPKTPLEKATKELKKGVNDENFLRLDEETPELLAIISEQNSEFKNGFAAAFVDGAKNAAKKNIPLINNGYYDEVDQKQLSELQLRALFNGIEPLFDYLQKNAKNLLTPESLELLREAAMIIKNKKKYPKILATVPSVFCLRILMPMVKQAVAGAMASKEKSPQEFAAMLYIQQTLQSFANDPTKLGKHSRLDAANNEVLVNLIVELAPRLDDVLKTLLEVPPSNANA